MNKLSTSTIAMSVAPNLTTTDGWAAASRLFTGLLLSFTNCCDGLRRRIVIVGAVALVITGVSAPGQNILVNGGFEDNPPTAADTPWITPSSAIGNHQGWPITPWVLGTGQIPNVVTVDGVTSTATSPSDPLGHERGNYGTDGPHFDASGSPKGVERHYLDIANGTNDIYQSFTPQCDGEVDFGGFFSTRANHSGSANVSIVQGVGTSGQVVGATNPITVPSPGQPNHSDSDPWTPVSFHVLISANMTYSFVVHMDDYMNFDEGFVRYENECSPTPTPTPKPSPACAQVADKDIHCEPNGGYSYIFSVTNNSEKDVSQVLLTPVQDSSFNLSQQLFNLSPALHDGQSTTLTVKIKNVKPGTKPCFFLNFVGKDHPCCIIKVCPILPNCAGGKTPTPPGRR